MHLFAHAHDEFIWRRSIERADGSGPSVYALAQQAGILCNDRNPALAAGPVGLPNAPVFNAAAA